MSHLTRDELVAWRDRQPGVDRDRVLTHLGSCRSCTASYAELVRTAPADEAPLHFKAEDFVERGYAARREARQGWSAALSSWKLWSGVVTAAAAVILVVTLAGGPGSGPSTELRGSTIEVTSATVMVGQPVTLSWSTGLHPSKYFVVLISPAGGELFRSPTEQTSIRVPVSVTRRLLPGTTYSWKVTALDADGQPITSATGTLAVAAATR